MDLREESRKEVLGLFESGVTKSDIGRRLGVSEAAIRRWLEYYITTEPSTEDTADEEQIDKFRTLLSRREPGNYRVVR